MAHLVNIFVLLLSIDHIYLQTITYFSQLLKYEHIYIHTMILGSKINNIRFKNDSNSFICNTTQDISIMDRDYKIKFMILLILREQTITNGKQLQLMQSLNQMIV